MIQEIEDKSNDCGKQSPNTNSARENRNCEPDQATINTYMYKYGGSDEKASDEKSNFFGQMQNSALALHNNPYGRTNMSFGAGRGAAVFDLRKAENITMQLPVVFRQDRPLDAVVMQL